MSSAKFVNIARLMTTYNFEIDRLPDKLKCAKCKLVLKDACLVSCGCIFCRICIDNMKTSGVEFCAGDSESCGESPLSSFVSDFKTNNSISRLTVKCPNQGCVHECQLENMEEHLQECQRKIEECPFRELGCTQDNLAAEDMNGHFQQGNREHNKILIEMITKINIEVKFNRREIEMLKQRDEDNRKEIEMFKHELVVKDGQIRMLNDQIIHLENDNKSIMQAKEDLDGKVRILQEKIEREFNRNDELNGARMIDHVDGEIASLTTAIGSNKDEFATEMRSVRYDIRSIKDDISSTKLQVQSIQALVGQVDAQCELVIDADLSQMSWTEAETTDYFTGTVHPYKYQLSSYNQCDRNEALWIYLRIHPGLNDGQLAWPFEGRVVINVADKISRERCKSISRQCRIDRPPAGNNWKFSEKFVFRHSELIGARLDFARGVRLLCMIVPGVG